MVRDLFSQFMAAAAVIQGVLSILQSFPGYA